MKILLSPAKKMNVNTDDLAPEGLPVFLEQTEEILRFMQGLSYGEAKKLWACNDRIAEQNYDRLKHMDLCHRLTPGILPMKESPISIWRPLYSSLGSFSMCRNICGSCPHFTAW